MENSFNLHNSEHRLLRFKDKPSNMENRESTQESEGGKQESYDQKLLRFQEIRSSIEKQIAATKDPKLRQEYQQIYNGFLEESSRIFADMKELGISRDKLIDMSLLRINRFVD